MDNFDGITSQYVFLYPIFNRKKYIKLITLFLSYYFVNYTSILLAYIAFVSMNSRLGSTLSPISTSKS